MRRRRRLLANIAYTLLLCSVAAAAASAQHVAPTPAPTPLPTAEKLPEIGRVRAITPSCVAMRDLIIPAFQTAQKVDARFDKNAEPLLPKYIQAVDEGPDNPLQRMRLSYLQQQVSLMQDALQSIDAALDDRRLRNARDAETISLRDKLQDLYDAQSGRANILWEFLTREHVKAAKQEADTLAGRSATSTPDPFSTPQPYAMPPLTGITIVDERTMTGWGRSLASAVRTTEVTTAGTFAVVASSCS